MNTSTGIRRTTKAEQKIAMESYDALAAVVKKLNLDKTEIEIEEKSDKIIIPVNALRLLVDILKAMGEGKSVSIIPVAMEITTQKAAEILGCSRPFLVNLLEQGKIPFTKVGKHRRLKIEDILEYKNEMKRGQKKHLIDIMNLDEEAGLYDS